MQRCRGKREDSSMAKVEINKDEIAEFMLDYIDWEGTKDTVGKLKEFDWNPFDEDGDEFVGAWAEMRHNSELVIDVAKALVNTAERVVVGGLSLSASQKRDAVVKALDNALRLPWYAEPFDGIALGIFVDMVVAFMNKVDWGIAPLEDLNIVKDAGGAWAEGE